MVFPSGPLELRPRSIGELLDRAVTLAVRHAGPLLLALAIAALPVALLNVLLAPDAGKVWGVIGAMVNAKATGHAAEAARLQRQLAMLQGGGRSTFAILGVAMLLWPLAHTIYFRVLAAADTGATVALRSAVAAGVQRWLPQLVVGLITIAFAVPLLIGWGFALAIVALLAAALMFVSKAAAGIAFAIVAIVSVLIVLAIYGVLVLLYDFATLAVALETSNPVRGFGSALRRVFDRRSLRRSVLVALAMIALSFGGTIAGLVIGGGIAAVTQVGSLATAAATIVALIVELIRLAFIAQYAADVRVRREGHDLALAAAAMEPSPLVP